jgi:poly(3-hydroxyalkanoate) synthetase
MEQTTRWTQQQIQRMGRFQEVAFRPAECPQWTTPNSVVLDLPALSLRKFVFHEGAVQLAAGFPLDHRPLLIVTPQVNHSAICDYAPEQSLVAMLHQHGFTDVYATEWKSATLERADESLDDIIATLGRCTEHLGGKVHLIGLCQGGWMSLIYAALRPSQVISLVLAAAPVDFHAELSAVSWIALLYPMTFYQWLVMCGGGIMRGELISTGFNNLRFFERYYGKYLDLYQHIDEPDYVERFRRLADWYETHQHIPGRAYLEIVRLLFKENRLVKGQLQCCGEKVDLQRVEHPLYMLAGTRDHITPPKQLFAASQFVSSRIARSYTTDAGHIGVFMGKSSLQQAWPDLLRDLHRDTAQQ